VRDGAQGCCARLRPAAAPPFRGRPARGAPPTRAGRPAPHRPGVCEGTVIITVKNSE
jgi:hypothetical protein